MERTKCVFFLFLKKRKGYNSKVIIVMNETGSGVYLRVNLGGMQLDWTGSVVSHIDFFRSTRVVSIQDEINDAQLKVTRRSVGYLRAANGRLSFKEKNISRHSPYSVLLIVEPSAPVANQETE